MLKDDLGIFLVNISKIYPIDKDRDFDGVIKQTLEYLLEYYSNKKIDLKKAQRYIFDNYKYKSFPEPVFLKDALKDGVIIQENVERTGGDLVIQIMPDGKIRQYKDVGFGKSAEELKQGGKVYRYPKGSVLIGNKVFMPDGDDRVFEIGDLKNGN